MTNNPQQPDLTKLSLPRVSLTPDPRILERNLTALSKRSPIAADQIRSATSSSTIEFALNDRSELIATFEGRALCSKRRPHDEATKWATRFDPHDVGVLAVMGFTLGHHLFAAAQHFNNESTILCYEPDINLLRAVLERVDHSQWIKNTHFVLTTSADTVTIDSLLEDYQVLITAGVELVTHPPSTNRLSNKTQSFSKSVKDVVGSSRTHLVTALAHSGYTIRNLLMNIGYYTTCPGISTLKDACIGRPAILIAAGPSLARNLHLLEQDPTLRDRCVIIAVQTMLKPLLKRGIKPHFVTALDHHEISTRFYEGLTEEDLQGVRLIIEPKANGAIPRAYPGEILCAADKQLDTFIGPQLKRDMGELPAGGTVAHLNYYLARYLGCATIILIGQDLGFSDNQYYAPGAAIHNVWAPELSHHRSLEMFEWERIVRMKGLIKPRRDINNRIIFTDEQMSSYIAQFESDFTQDTKDDALLRVINATEGGVKLASTTNMTLQDAIDTHIPHTTFPIPETKHLAVDTHAVHHTLRSQLKLIIRQLKSIGRLSEKTLSNIDRALENKDNQSLVDQCIDRIQAARKDVLASQPGFEMLNHFNQRGSLERFNKDREIRLRKIQDPTELLFARLERDRFNVTWIEDSSREVCKLVERTIEVIDNKAPPMTRDEFADESIQSASSQSTDSTSEEPTLTIAALIFADTDLGPLATPRDLTQPIYNNQNALELTLARLAHSTLITTAIIATPTPDRINAMNLAIAGLDIIVEPIDPEPYRTRARSIGTARLPSSDTWRGSLGGLSTFDEGFDPIAAHTLISKHNFDGAAIISSDAPMLDPSLVDQITKRYLSEPDRCLAPFSQAVPGIGCCVLSASTIEGLSNAAEIGSMSASIGALYAYIPEAPQSDQIASPLCVSVETSIRDASVRALADSTLRVQALASTFNAFDDPITTPSATLLHTFVSELSARAITKPTHIIFEPTTARLHPESQWASLFNTTTHESASHEQITPLIKEASLLRDDTTITFAGRGNPLAHQDIFTMINEAQASNIPSIELRTDLLQQTEINPTDLITAGLTTLSVDVLADNPSTYESFTNTNSYDQLLDTIQELFNARTKATNAFPTPWILPRITRTDETLTNIINFYDRWLAVCGCATIDPKPSTDPNTRINPLPIPSNRNAAIESNTMRIRADGLVADASWNPIGSINAFEMGIEGAARALHSHNAALQETKLASLAQPHAVAP